MANVRRAKIEQDRKLRQMIYTTIGLLVVVYLTFIMIFGENGLLKYLKLRHIRNELIAETELIKKQNKELRKEIETIEKNPEQLEDLARKYRLVKEGELLFIFEK